MSVEGARKAAKSRAAQVAANVDPVAEKRAQRDRVERERAEILGGFIDGDYKKWAEGHLKSHAATLSALKADFGNEGGDGHKSGEGWWEQPDGA